MQLADIQATVADLANRIEAMPGTLQANLANLPQDDPATREQIGNDLQRIVAGAASLEEQIAQVGQPAA